MDNTTSKLIEADSIGVVTNGKIVGEYDFYSCLNKLEGKTIKWKLELVETSSNA